MVVSEAAVEHSLRAAGCSTNCDSLAARLTRYSAATTIWPLGALFECQRRGIRVPKDLSIIGFNDLELGRQQLIRR